MNNSVLLVIGNSLISRRIQAHTQQDDIPRDKTVSHVAYKFWYDSTKNPHKRLSEFKGCGWFVVESHFDSGVAVFSFDKWQKANKNNQVIEVPDDSYNLTVMLDQRGKHYSVKDILRLKLETDLEFLNKNKFVKFVGKPLILGLKVLQTWFKENDDGVYCSELLLLGNNLIANLIGKKPYESFPSDLQKYYIDKGLIK